MANGYINLEYDEPDPNPDPDPESDPIIEDEEEEDGEEDELSLWESWTPTQSDTKLLQITTTLQTLLQNTGAFQTVLIGYNDKYKKTVTGDVAIIFEKKEEYDETMGRRSNPEHIETFLGIVLKGTQTVSHQKAVKIKRFLSYLFREESDWSTLEGNVRNTFIMNSEIVVSDKTKLTYLFMYLKHDVRWIN